MEVTYARRGEETSDVNVREGGTESRISTIAAKEGGSLVGWAMADRKQMRTGLQLRAEGRDLRRAIVGGDR